LLLEQGWLDAIRHLHPTEPMYTFWDYMRNRWARDAGLRIDFLLLSASVKQRLVRAGVDRDVRGREDASDHAPVWIELRDASTAQTAVRKKTATKKKQRRRKIG
jgi:exodeoxyribonuclease-3